jgi:hypothetical protein
VLPRSSAKLASALIVFSYWPIVDSMYPAARSSATTTEAIPVTVVSTAGSSPQGVWTRPTLATNQRNVKPKNQSLNPTNTGHPTIPRLNAKLGIIAVVDHPG